MNRLPARRRTVLGFGLDGAGIGPDSSDGQTRLTRGEDYVLLGGSDELHGVLQAVIEAIAASCRDEGTTLGTAPPALLNEILEDLGEDLEEFEPDSDSEDDAGDEFGLEFGDFDGPSDEADDDELF